MKFQASLYILIYYRQSGGEYKIKVVNLNFIVRNWANVTENMDACVGNGQITVAMGTNQPISEDIRARVMGVGR